MPLSFRLSCGVLLVLLCTGCGTRRMVRLDTGQGKPVLYVPGLERAEPVQWEQEEFVSAVVNEARRVRPAANPEQAARELFGVSARSGWYGFTQSRQVIPLEGQPEASRWDPVAVAMTQQYLRFCEARGQPGDCRGVLLNSPVLTRRCRTLQQCRESLVRQLQILAKQIAEEGSELNRLVTQAR